VRLDRETASAVEIATWLADSPHVARVMCPMLPGSVGHQIWKRDFSGGCGLFSIVLHGGGAARRNRFIDALRLFGIGYSWGGFESLVSPVDPASIRKVMPWPPAGIDAADRFGVRFSIGLEDPADLIADIERALEA
jgi:cystathionine beta-lyase